MTCRNTILSAFVLAMGLGVAQSQGNVVSSASAASMTFNDGHIIPFTYDADGRKLKAENLLSGMLFLDWDVKNVSPAAIGEVIERPSLIVKPVTQTTVQYCANHVYRNGALERVDNGYGYWADSTYHYNIADYQGNIRAVVAADGTLEEVNNYYPYGALMAAGGVQPYKYGGKEVERENGLDWYDSRARWYDSLTGRTPTLDSKADHYTSLSPYLWCAGNPMKYEDRDGRYLKGSDGRAVTFDTKKGWSSNVTSGIAKIGGAMMKTKIGRDILNKMIQAKYPITLAVSYNGDNNSIGEISVGETYTDYIKDSNGNAQDFKEVVIIIYEQRIKNNMLEDEMYKDTGLSTSDIISTVSVHEGTHGTFKEANSSFVSEIEAEQCARCNEQKAIDELRKKRDDHK